MKEKVSNKEIEAVILVFIMIYLPIWVGFTTMWYLFVGPEREYLAVVWKGMEEEDMLKRMEKIRIKPTAVYTKADAPRHYYLKNYMYKERPISNKVYIYEYDGAVAYYWVNPQGKIEEVYIGEMNW